MGIAAVGVVVSVTAIPNTTSETRIWDEVGGRRKQPLAPTSRNVKGPKTKRPGRNPGPYFLRRETSGRR